MLGASNPGSNAEWYDEFAIGWNEIFDPDPPVISDALVLRRDKEASPSKRGGRGSPSSSNIAPSRLPIKGRDFSPHSLPEEDQQLSWVIARSKSKLSGSTSSRGADTGLLGLEDQLPQKTIVENVPPWTASTTTGGASAANAITQPSSARSCPIERPNHAFFTSEILTSKKPPAYLRIGSRTAKQSAIDTGIKERLLDHPVSQPRKGADFMEEELKQLRHEISEKHRAKRKEARRHRRLVRRNRVKPYEDLEELELQYKNSEHLKPFADPVEKSDSWVSSTPTAKTFFAKLGAKQFAPLSAR